MVFLYVCVFILCIDLAHFQYGERHEEMRAMGVLRFYTFLNKRRQEAPIVLLIDRSFYRGRQKEVRMRQKRLIDEERVSKKIEGTNSQINRAKEAKHFIKIKVFYTHLCYFPAN